MKSSLDTNVNTVEYYPTIETFRNIAFNRTFNTLTELELNIDEGIILDKQLPPNMYLTHLTISLQQVDDLFVLFDGLAPKLIFLNVTVWQSDVSQRLSMRHSWSHRFMSHLIEFRLTTYENVTITFDHLHDIVMPLNQVEKFTLDVGQLISNDKQFINRNQIDMLTGQYMPCLRQFHCSIQTMENIDKQSFATMNEHWPMAYQSAPYNNLKILYTVPWSLEELNTSMLADDDTVSSCPNVEYLIIDKPQTNLARRFPNIHTLDVRSRSNLSHDEYVKLRRLRLLITNNIAMIPSPVGRNIDSLTLFSIENLLEHPIIYSDVRYVNLKNAECMSLTIVTALVQHFPSLRSLQCQLEPTTQYYDCLKVLLDGQHLPNLLKLKTNWIHNDTYCSNIQLWISAKTPLKWRLTPFLVHCYDNWLTICL
ncbi:unnamed protein product [Rotaria sp. Silwood1]|nr:unnamed protein product [Rotaria sp. Silwood1]